MRFRESDGYIILKSPLAYHDLDKNIISADEGSIETFKYESDNTNPLDKIIMNKFEFLLNNKKNSWKIENAKGQVKVK